MPGEFDFIEWVRSQQRASDFVPLPAGDDLAVLRWKADDLLLVGVDQVLDGIHFDSTIHSPRQIGRKVMKRNLSDCAAMACLPAAALAAVALPKGASIDYARELYLGLRDAADPFDCPIIGGDTASWPARLALTVTILGRSAGIQPITRAGARPGDQIRVTGPLGGSILGRHMTYEPRIHEARALAATGLLTSMIDLSDGLSRDLGHICAQSGVGALLFEHAIPIHPDALAMAPDGLSPLEHALHDGEDYELLYTSPEFADGLSGTRIGIITAEPGIRVRTASGDLPVFPKAWEHPL